MSPGCARSEDCARVLTILTSDAHDATQGSAPRSTKRWLMPRTASSLALGSGLILLALAGGSGPLLAQTPFVDSTPSGMVAFFMSSGATCPPGWQAATQAQGRLILGAAAPAAPFGTALTGPTPP